MIIKYIVSSVTTFSYYVTLISGMSGSILYISGIKKGKYIAIGSGVVYFIIELIGYGML